VEHSIDNVFAVLTGIGSELMVIRKEARSASTDGQTAHEKGNALVADNLGRRRERVNDRTEDPRPRARRLRPPPSQVIPLVLHLASPHPDENGFHLHRLAALSSRKRILLQLRAFFFWFRVVAELTRRFCAHRHSFLGSCMSRV
jgi:hypothetical protein